MDDEMRNFNENVNENTEVINDVVEDRIVNDENSSVRGMSDEEIRAAAENIGAVPYVSYNREEEVKEDNNSNYTNYDYSNSYDPRESIPVKKKKKHFFKKAAKFLGLAACFGLVAGAVFNGVSFGMNKLLYKNEETNILKTEVVSETENALNRLGANSIMVAATSTTKENMKSGNAVVDVVKNNMSCTVCVGISQTITQRDMWTGRTSSYEVEGGGSGFIVGMSDSEIFVATNNHVVENADKITITFSDDESVPATTRATDPDNDLAIVSVPKDELSSATLNEIKVATLGSSDDTEVGEMVVAIGNALGYGTSVTVGYLSAKDRTVTYENREMKLLQTDAAINEGNSGGPLFNIDGEVIGINCAKYSDESVEGMCFAIPISAAIPILDDLINREIVAEEDQGYLGITIADVTDNLASMLGIPKGVRVQSVVENGSAAKAGIYSGDVITAVNGVTVTSSDQLKSKVNSFKYGKTIQITLQRLVEGTWQEKTLDVELMKRPSTD